MAKRLSRLRAWREREGLSRPRAAQLFGISAQWLDDIESGRVPSDAIAQRIEAIVGEPLAALQRPVVVRGLPETRIDG